MRSRNAKRKRMIDMKNMLVNSLNQLTLSSAELTDDLHAANMSFQIFYKSMEDRQSELFARTIGLEIQYGDLIDVLKGDQPITSGETSQNPVQFPASYQENTRKFFDDSCTSLNGHVNQFKTNMDEIIHTFNTFEVEWKKKMDDLKNKAEQMGEQRAILRARIRDFSGSM